jgi:outer membrane lipoprotein SlyB
MVNWSTAMALTMDPVAKERALKNLLGIAVALALSACATSNPNVVPVYGAQRMSHVYDATVLSVRPITIDGSQSGIGAGAGAIAGGIAGSNVGGGNGAVVGSVIGAVIGGVTGNAVERSATQQNGVEIIVQLRDGQRRAIVQGATPDVFAPGDPVILIVTGANTRVQRAPQVGQSPAYPAPATHPAPATYPVPADYPNAPVQPVYPASGPVPPRT